MNKYIVLFSSFFYLNIDILIFYFYLFILSLFIDSFILFSNIDFYWMIVKSKKLHKINKYIFFFLNIDYSLFYFIFIHFVSYFIYFIFEYRFLFSFGGFV